MQTKHLIDAPSGILPLDDFAIQRLSQKDPPSVKRARPQRNTFDRYRLANDIFERTVSLRTNRGRTGESGRPADRSSDHRHSDLASRLGAARGLLGSWHTVADELTSILGQIHNDLADRSMAVAAERIASKALNSVLSRAFDLQDKYWNEPRTLLVTVGDTTCTLQRKLTEICLLEANQSPWKLDRRIPTSDFIRVAGPTLLGRVALCATHPPSDAQFLQFKYDEVSALCEASGVELLLLGSAPWPEHPQYGHRLKSFRALHHHLMKEDIS